MVETIPPSSLGLTCRVVPVVDDEARCRKGDGRDGCRPNDAINPAIDNDRTNDNPNGDGEEKVKDSSPSKRLPIVSVHLERLVGYQPETDEEIDSIRSQLISAMWTRYHQGHQQDHLPKQEDVNVDGDNGDSGDGADNTHHMQDRTYIKEVEETNSNTKSNPLLLIVPPPDFDEQIQELLDAKVARFGIPDPLRYRLPQSSPSNRSDHHSTKPFSDAATTISKSSSTYFILPYPPKLLRPTRADSSRDDGPTPTIISSDGPTAPPTDWLQTEQVWAEIERLEFTLGKDRSQISTNQRPDETSYDTFNEYNDQEDDGNNQNGDHKDDDIDNNVDYNDDEYETPYDVEFLTRLAKHLRDTSRPLLWKHDMAKELQLCVEEELARLDHNDWIQSKRQAKLDHLYTVRETLVHQAQLAQDRYTELDKIREDQVQQEIVQSTRRNKGYNRHGWSSVGSTTRDDGNKEYLDGFGTSDLSFPEEFQLLGMMPDKLRDLEEDEEEDDWGIDEENDDDSSTTSKSCYSGEVSDTDDVNGIGMDGVCNGEPHEKMPSTTNDDMALGVSNTQEDVKLHPEGQVATEDLDGFDMNQSSLKEDCNPLEGDAIQSPFLRRKEQRRKAKLRKQQERIDSRKLMEDELRSKYTTKDLILAQTLLQAMEKKVQSVEELLESLQDEVWAAEEEEHEQEGEEEQDWEQHDDSWSENKLATPNNKNSSFSLLDQVLAMILGALPIDPGCDVQEHFEYIRQEHAFIVEGWEAYFGRLPPASNIGTR